MAEYIIQGDTLTGIADAIRSKAGTSGTIDVSNMASAISNIETGSKVKTGTITFSSSGTILAVPMDFFPTKFVLFAVEPAIDDYNISFFSYDAEDEKDVRFIGCLSDVGLVKYSGTSTTTTDTTSITVTQPTAGSTGIFISLSTALVSIGCTFPAGDWKYIACA